MRHTLPKEERLSWKRHIDYLFEQGKSFIAYPLRVVYVVMEAGELKAPASFFVSVQEEVQEGSQAKSGETSGP
mgnify:CR=1 FL=1